MRSRDPRDRLQALDWVKLTYPRSRAAQVLRRLYKDPDSLVRARARAVAGKLGLRDVTLPDNLVHSRYRSRGRGGIGGWNYTGWSYGLYRRFRARKRPERRVLANRFKARKLPDVAAVLKMLELADAGELAKLCRPGTGPGAPYVEFDIAKASGGTRRISAPRQALKTIQRTILSEILSKLPVHDACHGFVPGRSTVSNAAPHQGARVVIKMDLVDFFPSIHYRRVIGLFEHYGYSTEVAEILARLTTHVQVLDDGRVVWPGVLPQGAPTSPAIANLVCRRLDMRLAGLAEKAGARYTRYADDLTFSFASDPEKAGRDGDGDGDGDGDFNLGRFCWWVDQICQQEGFSENAGKRRILRSGNQQRVTGIVVNSGMTVPRKARRRFRAILANCRKHGVASQARGRDNFTDYLRGFAAYIKMVQPELGSKLVAEVEAILAAERSGDGPGAES